MTKEIYLKAKKDAAKRYIMAAREELLTLKPNQKRKINNCKSRIARCESVIHRIDFGTFWEGEFELYYYESLIAPLCDDDTDCISAV